MRRHAEHPQFVLILMVIVGACVPGGAARAEEPSREQTAWKKWQHDFDKKIEKDLLKSEPRDDELRKLLKERYNSATREFVMLRERTILDPVSGWLYQIICAQNRRAQLILEISSNPADQAPALERFRAEAVEIEKLVKNRVAAKDLSAYPQDAEFARGHRLDIELMLLKVKSGTKLVSDEPPTNPKGVEKELLTPAPDDDDRRKLLKERYNSATREYAIYVRRWEIDPVATFLYPMCACGLRRAVVAIELFSKPEDRTRYADRLLGNARELETVMKNRYLSGGIAGCLPNELAAAQGHRLDVEIMLLKAKWPVKPTLNRDDKGTMKPEPGDDILRKLLKERHNAAEEQYKTYPSRREIDPLSTILEPLVESVLRRAEIPADLYPKAGDQVRAIEDILTVAKQLETAVWNRVQSGVDRETPWVYEKARGVRLEVEILLMKAKEPVKPPK